MYHLKMKYTIGEIVGHAFTLLLRPMHDPYILHSNDSSFNLVEYVMFNMLRGFNDPLSRSPEFLLSFLNSCIEQKSVDKSPFLKMFGFLWVVEEEKVPINILFVRSKTVVDKNRKRKTPDQ